MNTRFVTRYVGVLTNDESKLIAMSSVLLENYYIEGPRALVEGTSSQLIVVRLEEALSR
jgi:hypothetical protein